MIDEDRRPTAAPLVGALTGVFVAAASLALPWVGIGSAPGRSSIDLIGSLNALDVVGGPVLALLLGTWLAVPVAAASALVLGALDRSTGAAVIVLVVVGLIGAALGAIAALDVVTLAWGAALGGGAAAVAGVSAALVLVTGRRLNPGPPGADT